MAAASSFHPKEADNISERKLKVEKKKETEKEKKTRQRGEKAEPHTPEMFTMATSKKLAAGDPSQSAKLLKQPLSELLPDEDSECGSDDEQSVGSGDDETKGVVDLASLIDIKKP
jgi:hypothetical protein